MIHTDSAIVSALWTKRRKMSLNWTITITAQEGIGLSICWDNCQNKQAKKSVTQPWSHLGTHIRQRLLYSTFTLGCWITTITQVEMTNPTMDKGSDHHNFIITQCESLFIYCCVVSPGVNYDTIIIQFSVQGFRQDQIIASHTCFGGIRDVTC